MAALLKQFKNFVMRGNLIDMAIGFTVGATFSTVVKSLVDDIIMPPVGLLLGETDFSDAFVVLRAGPETEPPYASLQLAQAAGATTLNYGSFLTNVLALLIIAMAMFVVIRMIHKASEALKDEFGGDEKQEAAEPTTKKCAYCREVVPFKASRCSHCTSFLGVEGGPLEPDASVLPAGA
ncbi:MAG: large conductance mechanosensitive channel protein MscL [Rhodothermales bacterium]|nr:large conductance mechanosensitive channel protein MscL [Rhodothermales bacterium]MBO6779995.1 large conductance mechanosensitive channel protein MscL [Rhodothermales bacterium]